MQQKSEYEINDLLSDRKDQCINAFLNIRTIHNVYTFIDRYLYSYK